MFINTTEKYSPKSLNEFIFPDQESKKLATDYASGKITQPLILHGTSGTGKSLLQRLIPNAIENREAKIKRVKCADLKTATDIHDFYGRNKNFNRNFKEDDQSFNYIIIEEFLMTNARLIDALKIELDDTLGTDLTIISTNRFDKIDSAIRSRSLDIELKACPPQIFFPHAKKMFQAESVEYDDMKLFTELNLSYIMHADNRKYYQKIDSIFRKI